MKSPDAPDEWRGHMIRAWHLAILRFAVTLDNADRLGVFAVAAEADRLGGDCNGSRQFGFFRKTSAELCASILQQGSTADSILRQYLARIDDARLKHTLAAAIGFQQHDTTADKRPPGPKNDLWKGLTSPGDARL